MGKDTKTNSVPCGVARLDQPPPLRTARAIRVSYSVRSIIFFFFMFSGQHKKVDSPWRPCVQLCAVRGHPPCLTIFGACGGRRARPDAIQLLSTNMQSVDFHEDAVSASRLFFRLESKNKKTKQALLLFVRTVLPESRKQGRKKASACSAAPNKNKQGKSNSSKAGGGGGGGGKRPDPAAKDGNGSGNGKQTAASSSSSSDAIIIP